MANRYFKTLIQKIPLGQIDLTEMNLDMVTTDNIDFDTVSNISEISDVMVGNPMNVGLSVVTGTVDDYLVVPQSRAVQFTMTSALVIQGIVTYDKNGNVMAFVDFGNLREFDNGDIFTLELPSDVMRIRGNLN